MIEFSSSNEDSDSDSSQEANNHLGAAFRGGLNMMMFGSGSLGVGGQDEIMSDTTKASK